MYYIDKSNKLNLNWPNIDRGSIDSDNGTIMSFTFNSGWSSLINWNATQLLRFQWTKNVVLVLDCKITHSRILFLEIASCLLQ